MLVNMIQEEFEGLECSLSWKVIEPIIIQIKGQNLKIKSEMYKQLTLAQRAVFLFYTYHNHIHSATEFYWFAAYYITDTKSWPALKKDIEIFNHKDMVSIYEEIESVVVKKNQQPDGSWRDALASDLHQDIQLFNKIKIIYDRYILIAPHFINQMNDYVIHHPNEFVKLE